MKKVFCMLLIFVLLPHTSFSVDADFCGCWVFWMPNAASFGSGNLTTVLVLNEDGSAILMEHSTSSSNGAIPRCGAGTWEAVGDSGVMVSGGGVELFFPLKDDLLWVEISEKYSVGLKKVPDYETGQMLFNDIQ